MPEPNSLAVFRFARGFTQASLAEASGISRDTISRLERGDIPSLRTARAIANALGLDDVDELFPANDNGAPHQTRRSHNLQPLEPAGHGAG